MLDCPRCGTPCMGSHRYCPSCGSDLKAPRAKNELLTGMTLGDRFLLRELIGTGGMGKVYRADQKGVGRTVAVKIMHPHLVGDETAVARFTNEARATSQLNHPHSIGVIDFGQTENGVLYIVMEYLHGRPLDIVLRQEYPMPLGQVTYIMCQAMEAVHAAHQLSIIHRDLKPENIFLLERKSGLDFVKVLDFGIAKMLDHNDRSVTTPGLVPGTPEYMSPEQARGERLDPRSDVYSLGVIFYELLTQTVPFRGKSAVATMMAHVQEPPESPSSRAPNRGIPPALEAIVLWALAKDPADRIASAQHFREVVSAWAHVAGVWPEVDMRASSPDVLLDFFSEDQLRQFSEEIGEELGDQRTLAARAVRSAPLPRAAAADRLVGREALLRQLRSFVNGQGPRVLRLHGERGVGKAQLIRRLVSWARTSEIAVLHCRPDPGWTPRLLGTAHRVARFCLGQDPGRPPPGEGSDDRGAIDSRDGDVETLLAAASKLGMLAEDIPGLQELFGLPSHAAHLPPAVRSRERSAAFRHLVHAAAAARPLLLVLEEIDRHDDGSRALLNELIAALQGELRVLVTHSPDDPRQWPPEVQSIELAPLDHAASREVLLSLYDHPIGSEVAQQVLQAAGGVPLFIEQIAFAMHHDQLTRPPGNLVDLIAARLDALAQTERRLLQAMAVVRGPVTRDELCRLLDAEVDVALLDALVERGLLVAHEKAYAVIHDLVAVVTYSSIPAEVRREMHQLVAGILRARAAQVASSAYHAFNADDGPTAIDELDRAGAHACRCLDYAGAIHHYTRALELVRREWGRGRMSAVDLDQVAVDLAQRLAATLCETGDLLTAEGVLAEVLSVAAGRDVDRARLRLELGRIDLARGNRQRAHRHLQLALADLEGSDADWLRGEVLRELALTRGLMNEPDAAGELLHASLQLAAPPRSPGKPPPLLHAAMICFQIGLVERARGYLLDALQAEERARSPLIKLEILAQAAAVHQRAGEWAEAELRVVQAIDLAVQIGDRTRRATLLVDLARIRRISGDVEGARKQLEEAIRIGRTISWDEGIEMAQREAAMLRLAVPQSL